MHAITAKAGMVGLTRALAKELAPTITVNCVVPGTIDTVRGFAAGGNAGRASLPDNLAGRPADRKRLPRWCAISARRRRASSPGRRSM